MQTRFNIRRHADLVERMADAQGVDLAQAMMEGHLTPARLDDAVLVCTGCTATGACAHWLDAQGAGDATPDYCRNADLFADLSAEMRA